MKNKLIMSLVILAFGIGGFFLFIMSVITPADERAKMARLRSNFRHWQSAVTENGMPALLGESFRDPFSKGVREPYFIQLDANYLVVLSRGPDGIFQSIEDPYARIDEPESLLVTGDDIGLIVDIRTGNTKEYPPRED